MTSPEGSNFAVTSAINKTFIPCNKCGVNLVSPLIPTCNVCLNKK